MAKLCWRHTLYWTDLQCSPQQVADPREEFARASELLDMQPVYPPRQFFRSGEVYELPKEDDRYAPGTYIGHLLGVEHLVAAHGEAVFPLWLDETKISAAHKNTPFKEPIAFGGIIYPTVTVSSAIVGAFGAALPGVSSRFGFGSNKTVTIGFEHTMEYGLKKNETLRGTPAFENELRAFFGKSPMGSAKAHRSRYIGRPMVR